MTTTDQTDRRTGTDRILELFSMREDIVVVTGASSGIGQAAAEVYADAGATVVVLGRDRARLDEVRDAITAAGGTAHAYAADLSVPGTAGDVLERITAEVGRPTVVVANAGIAGGGSYRTEDGAIGRYTDEEWSRVVATNLNGTFETVRAAARVLPDHGRILVTSSTAGLRTDPMVSYAYGATKAGIVNLTRQLALELAPAASAST
ncbi:SDR family NAD(P)-dependent oxidoreductase [Citricoccus sp. SGAir0253]|uniref:SDR family NAD(P)-dependent oxidoreductase n=1 Tax=Citricoccus sp. SGAir0253 TaxID=2567881 RepID=UPI00110788C2|nr:SDR family NAD(P)-dependent oxidoreductase [Citricoccus sp. SGAir0253]QCU76987.1 SDR family NAD(P)-dependent oxidoreductase [Citricoccus sp. SGAir0253]